MYLASPIAITLLVRNDVARAPSPLQQGRGGLATSHKARIYYRDIGDYLSREKKLEIVKDMCSMLDPKMDLVEIHPNAKNDWINQRDGMPQALRKVAEQGREDCRELRSQSQKNAFAALARTREQIGEIVRGDVVADKRLIEASLVAGRPFVDHIVHGNPGFASLGDSGLAAFRMACCGPAAGIMATCHLRKFQPMPPIRGRRAGQEAKSSSKKRER